MADRNEEQRVRKIVEKYSKSPFQFIVEQVPVEDILFRQVKRSHIEMYVKKALNAISEAEKPQNESQNGTNEPGDNKRAKLDSLARKIKKFDDLTMDNFYGYDDEKNQLLKYLTEHIHLKQLLAPLKIRSSFHVLIDGLTGTGKTFLVQCLAGHLKIPVFILDTLPSDNRLLGSFFSNIIQFLKSSPQMIILMDSLDILIKLSSDNEYNDHCTKISHQIATFIDNVSDDTSSVIVATCSSSAEIDTSITRNERLDHTIHLGLPNQKCRAQILKSKLNGLIELSEGELQALVVSTPGFIVSDLNTLVRQAACNLFWDLGGMGDNLKLEGCEMKFKHLINAANEIVPSSQKYGYCTVPNTKWTDIGAMDTVKNELKISVLAPLYHPELCAQLNVTMSNGILLAGPPGCGKTLLAKALANEAGVNFISVKGPELLSMWVGESEKGVRNVFQNAKNSMPCVLFFDEIDSLCPPRETSAKGSSQHMSRLTNQMLTEMDGLTLRENVFVLAATNRLDMIDSAILRPGRFDKVIHIELPSKKDREQILNKHLDKIPALKNIDNFTQKIIQEISNDEYTKGFSGAELAGLVKEASFSVFQHILQPEQLNLMGIESKKLELHVNKENIGQLFLQELKVISLKINKDKVAIP